MHRIRGNSHRTAKVLIIVSSIKVDLFFSLKNGNPFCFQSIKVESTFLAFIIAFSCIALVIPSYLFILGILSLFSRSRCDDETETGALFPEAEESDCNDRVLVVMTLFVVLLCW